MIYTGPSFGMLSGGGSSVPTEQPLYFSAMNNKPQLLPQDSVDQMLFENILLTNGGVDFPDDRTFVISQVSRDRVFVIRWWCDYRKYFDDSTIKFSTWLEYNGTFNYSGCIQVLKQQNETLHGYNHFESHAMLFLPKDTNGYIRIWWWTGPQGELFPPPINTEIPSIPIPLEVCSNYVSLVELKS